MSIDDDVQRAIAHGELRELPMRLDSDPATRVVLLSKEVQELVLGPYRTRLHESRGGKIWADMDSFVRGRYVSICLAPKKAGKDADFGLLAPKSKATWDFRARNPSPSLRILGHFLEADKFVALTWWPKQKKVDWSDKEPLMRDEIRWRDAITECNERWFETLPNGVPIVGQRGENYVSTKFHLVGP